MWRRVSLAAQIRSVRYPLSPSWRLRTVQYLIKLAQPLLQLQSCERRGRERKFWGATHGNCDTRVARNHTQVDKLLVCRSVALARLSSTVSQSDWTHVHVQRRLSSFGGGPPHFSEVRGRTRLGYRRRRGARLRGLIT